MSTRRSNRLTVASLPPEEAAEMRKSRQEEAEERRKSRKSRVSVGNAEANGASHAEKRKTQVEMRKSQLEVLEHDEALAEYIGRPLAGASRSETDAPPAEADEGEQADEGAPISRVDSMAKRNSSSSQAPVRILPDDSGPGAVTPDEALYASCQLSAETDGNTFEQAVRWTTDNSHDLCGMGEEARFEGTAELLSGIASVSQAVDHLNVNTHLCPDGRCVVFSQLKQRYFLLYQVEKKKKAFSTFGIEEDAQEQWSMELSQDLCGKGEEATFEGKVPLMTQFSGVSEAVSHLNANPHLCLLGQCVVFSVNKQRFFLLFQAETKQKAISLFNFHDQAEEGSEGGESDEQRQSWIEELEDADSDASDYDIEGMFEKMPEKARADREVALAAIGRSGKSFQHASASLRSDKEVIIAAVEKSGLMLEYAEGPERQDRDVAKSALHQDGMALQHLGDDLRADKELVLEAVKLDGRALAFASEELKSDPQISYAALTQLEVPDVPLESPGRKVGLATARKSGAFITVLPQAVREDREILLEAVSQQGTLLEVAPEKLQSDKDLVMVACEQNGNALQFAGEDMKADKEVVLAAVRENFYALKYADQSLREDEDVVTAAIQQNLDFI